MKLTPWYAAALSPLALIGFGGAFAGQLAVLAVTCAIFFGTLSLGKTPAPDAARNGTRLG